MPRTMPWSGLCEGCGGELTVHEGRRVTYIPPIRCAHCQIRVLGFDPAMTREFRCPDCGTAQRLDAHGNTEKVGPPLSSHTAWSGPWPRR